MSHEAWHDANQRHLVAALALVRHALERHLGQTPTVEEGALRADLQAAIEAMPTAPALDTLGHAFGLSEFERDLVLLCAGPELDGSFAELCGKALGDPRRTAPTFSLALAALPGAHWSALTPPGPLRRWRLLEVLSGDALTSSPLRLDERVLHYLAGVSCMDERLEGLVQPIAATTSLSRSQHAAVERIQAIWSPSVESWTVVELRGSERGGKHEVAAAACASLGLQLLVLRAEDLPHSAAERDTLARLWEREAALSASALLLECEALEGREAQHGAVRFAEALQSPLLVATPVPLAGWHRRVVPVEVNRPGRAEQHALWQAALGPFADQLNGTVDRLASQFDLGMREIESASLEIREGGGAGRQEGLESLLWESCRAQARPRLDDLAQRIEPAATWDDLVVPELQRQSLRDVAVHVRHRATVYEKWGFAGKGSRGLGISALFAGPSGTGKTMAAEVLANELRMDLYRVDLSAVVSKYIGETEKHLRRVFDAAEGGGSILLFDEADAIFGKRSEVKDSHDRYANIEVSYLLQRMEAYRGLAILTTNLREALDTAFLRRIRFVVEFPFPETEQRAEIWRRIFPARTPTESLDVGKLARLAVPGGNIRNIALNAAFLAADAGEPVRMGHLLHAAQGEYAKLQKPLTQSEVGGWA